MNQLHLATRKNAQDLYRQRAICWIVYKWSHKIVNSFPSAIVKLCCFDRNKVALSVQGICFKLLFFLLVLFISIRDYPASVKRSRERFQCEGHLLYHISNMCSFYPSTPWYFVFVLLFPCTSLWSFLFYFYPRVCYKELLVLWDKMILAMVLIMCCILLLVYSAPFLDFAQKNRSWIICAHFL